MKKFAQSVVIAAVLAAGLVAAQPAFAEESSTTQTVNGTNVNNSSSTVICNTGAYGTNNCYSTTNQSITQVLGATDRSKLYHKPTGTGVDGVTIAGAVVTMITTAGGAMVTIKKYVK